MFGVIVGSLMVERELKRAVKKANDLGCADLGPAHWHSWRAFMVRDKCHSGRESRYVENPSEILKIWQAVCISLAGCYLVPLHLLIYLRKNKLDPWIFLDSAGPAVLIGQAIGRIANFINQELYGPPTTLPWGIPISAQHRLASFADMIMFPV